MVFCGESSGHKLHGERLPDANCGLRRMFVDCGVQAEDVADGDGVVEDRVDERVEDEATGGDAPLQLPNPR